MDTIDELEQAEAEYRFAKKLYNEKLFDYSAEHTACCIRNPENILDTDDIDCIWTIG